MNHNIVNSLEPVTLVGGGVVGVNDLKQAVLLAKQCIVADGGLGHVLAAGLIPKAVIGDIDSANAAELRQIGQNLIHKIADQDSTDFEKALDYIAAPVILAVGFTGGRIDHQMAVLNALVTHRDQCVVVVAETEIILHLPVDITLPTQAGDVVSLFPMRETSGTSQGLKWPIAGLNFAPDGKIGTSNLALGSVEIHTNSPGLLAIIPRTRLEDLMQVLLAQPVSSKWRARA